MTSVTPVMRPEPSQSDRPGEEARASRISLARSRVLLTVDAERVGRLVGRSARLMIRRRVRVESDPPSTGGSAPGLATGICSHTPIPWRSPGVGQAGCREPLAPTCDAVVTVV
jgi:hypothetical protein